MEVPLKEHLEVILAERDRRYEQRFKDFEDSTALALANAKEALAVALAGVDKSNVAAFSAYTTLAAKAEEFADQKLETHNQIKPWMESLIATQVARIEQLERRVARFENREEGMGLTWKIAIAALGAVATLVGLWFAFA